MYDSTDGPEVRPYQMKILVAPDKFKGVLTAREVAENIAAGLRETLPDARIDIVPLADGGEGTAEVICDALGGSWLKCKTHDPLGREIEGRYVCIDKRKLAVMEMSEAAGMRRLQPGEHDVDLASTFGVGEMILDATGRGVQEIIVGLGGSATNDGGFGMARALGFRFFQHADAGKLDGLKPSSLQGEERELGGAVSELMKLTRILHSPQSSQRSAQSRSRGGRDAPGEGGSPRIIAAADVRNPLLGENGATRVFGPQKGATADKIDTLEHALARLADVVAQEFGFDYRDNAGAGAAGGLGFGLMSFCAATMRPGFEIVAEAVGLESKMKGVDLVITGEGSLDRQTLGGKTPAGVAQLARQLGKRVYAIVGHSSADREVESVFDRVYQLCGRSISIEEAKGRPKELLREMARELGSTLRV